MVKYIARNIMVTLSVLKLELKQIIQLILVVLVVISMSFTLNKDTILTRAELLAGSTFKKWNIIDNYPKEELISSCNYPNNHSMDNTWTFKSDYSCSFDPGLIKKSDTTDFRSCRDPRSFEGSWQLLENDTKLKIEVSSLDNIQAPTNTIIMLEIKKMVQDTMVVILNENTTANEYVFTTK